MPRMANTRVLQETAVRYFLEVVRCGSITKASEKLNVASSAVSRQIARLEEELGTPLFDRHARGTVPNAAGELLAAYALRMQLETERIGNELLALKGLRRGDVKIACNSGFAVHFVPTLVESFRRQHPGIHSACRSGRVPKWSTGCSAGKPISGCCSRSARPGASRYIMRSGRRSTRS